MSLTEIKSMSRDEQLLVMEMLWDELCHKGQEPESPQWHKDILDKRQARIAEGKVEYLTLNDQLLPFRITRPVLCLHSEIHRLTRMAAVQVVSQVIGSGQRLIFACSTPSPTARKYVQKQLKKVPFRTAPFFLSIIWL